MLVFAVATMTHIGALQHLALHFPVWNVRSLGIWPLGSQSFVFRAGLKWCLVVYWLALFKTSDLKQLFPPEKNQPNVTGDAAMKKCYLWDSTLCIVLRNFPGGECQVAAGAQVAACIAKVRLEKFPLSWDVHGQHCRVKCCFTSSEPAFHAVSQNCKVPITESPGCVSCVLCSHPPQSTCFRSVINGWFEEQILQGI